MRATEGATAGRTPAEAQGMTAALGRAAAAIAAEALAEGQARAGREILEGLVLTNPYDPAPWVMLAVIERRQGRLVAARVCAETAFRLAPRDPQVRLVRAEVLLGGAAERPRARAELASLAAEPDGIGARARALLAALGAPP